MAQISDHRFGGKGHDKEINPEGTSTLFLIHEVDFSFTLSLTSLSFLILCGERGEKEKEKKGKVSALRTYACMLTGHYFFISFVCSGLSAESVYERKRLSFSYPITIHATQSIL
jgi:hypothetical protein